MDFITDCRRKKKSLILALTLLIVVTAQARTNGRLPTSPELKKWKACQTTTECTVSNAPCGLWVPINKKFQATYSATFGGMRCLEKLVNRPQPVPQCINHECVVPLTKAASAAKPPAPKRHK